MAVRLQVNVDHVATLRQARGTAYPDPVQAAELAEDAGAHGITVHLREDRRHIQDADVSSLRHRVRTALNLEMAATDEMVTIARRIRPDLVTLVPERREERTTEGGLNVTSASVQDAVTKLHQAECVVSLFVDPELSAIEAAQALGVSMVELHTGDYADSHLDATEGELKRLAQAAAAASEGGLRVAAGHGLTVENTPLLIQRLPSVEELNIGHALVSDAVFIGFEAATREFLTSIARGEALR